MKYRFVVKPLRSECDDVMLALLGFLSIIEAYNDFSLAYSLYICITWLLKIGPLVTFS